MFGYDDEREVIGRMATDFVADESRAEVERRVASNIEGPYEIIGKRKDGKKIIIELGP